MSKATKSLGLFALKAGLVYAAIALVKNGFDIALNNPFQDAIDSAEALTLGLLRLQKVQDEVSNSRNPNTTGRLKLAEGWELPKNWFGNLLRPLVGGYRLNWDNAVRNRLQSFEVGVKSRIADSARFLGLAGVAAHYDRRANNPNFKTGAQLKQNRFDIASGDLIFKSNQVLMEHPEAVEAAKKIAELDEQLAEIGSGKLDRLSSEQDKLAEALESERAINKERDKYLKTLTQQQQMYQRIIQANNKLIAQAEERFLAGEYETREDYERDIAPLIEVIDAKEF